MSSGKYRKEHNCLNCGSHVEQHYCSSCGQPNIELKESFWAFLTHSIGHYFHFESKFFSTLKPLLTEPGTVTLDYLAGKRARYINPVSMYIFVSIVYFIIIPQVDHSNQKKHPTPTKAAISVNQADSIKKELNKEFNPKKSSIVNSTLNILLKDLSEQEIKNLSIVELDQAVKQLKARYLIKPTDSLEDLIEDYESELIDKQDTTYSAYLNRQATLSAAEKDNWLERSITKRKINLREKSKDGHWTYAQEIEHYRPKQYFLLMPLFALFIMWNFRRNKIYYLDHLIFTIHGMTAFFIVQIITMPIRAYVFGLDSIISSLISATVFFAAIWYLYRALQIFYNRSKAETIKKMITICILFGLAYWLSLWIIKQFIYVLLV